VESARSRDRDTFVKHVGFGFAFVAALAVGYMPQLMLQWQLDEVFFVDTYGVGNGRFSGLAENLTGFLWDRGDGSYWGTGLFLAMPVLVLVCLGFAPLVRRDPRFGLVVLVSVAVQASVICAYEVYWGYHTFASPYLMPASPIFALAFAHTHRKAEAWFGARGVLVLGAIVIACVARNIWCLLHHVADDLIGGWATTMPASEILTTLLFLEPKLHDGVLAYSSEFGCLLREATGALRTGDLALLLATVGWFSLLALPVAAGVWWRNGASRNVGVRARRRLWVSMGAAGLAASFWLWGVAGATDLDHDYHTVRWTERKREMQPRMLVSGKSHQWRFTSDSPLERLYLVTFLTDAADIPQDTPVARVQIRTGNGQPTKRPLLAGVDTADFAVDRPESSALTGHRVPLDRTAWSYRVRDDSSHFYTARAYVTEIALPKGTTKGTAHIRSTVPHGAVALALLVVDEAPVRRERGRRRWLAGRW
jgi:hypothetical protein